MPTLPPTPAGLTPEYLTELLQADGCLPSAGQVVSLELTQVGEGTGMMAELSRASLRYAGDQGQAPDSLIAKYASSNKTNRAAAQAFNLPERETRYATELAPQTTTITPRTYCSLLDGDRFLLLMEDLSDYQVGSQAEGATLKQTELAIDELAKLHSAFWAKVDQLDWVPGIANSYHADVMLNGAKAGWDKMASLFNVPGHINQHKDRFLAAIPTLQAERMAPPITLAHGDFRMENLLYGNQPSHHGVVVIDWQGPLKARGMFDVALFLGQSAKTEVRRQHETALLKRYLTGLQAGGVKDITLPQLQEDYVRCMLYDWVYTAVVAGTLDTSNKKTFAWMSQMVARQVAASDDLRVFDQLP
ncbi:MAG: phosphotransferase [Pseudomonadales bacterium]